MIIGALGSFFTDFLKKFTMIPMLNEARTQASIISHPNRSKTRKTELRQPVLEHTARMPVHNVKLSLENGLNETAREREFPISAGILFGSA
jgi:hypothetical protein